MGRATDILNSIPKTAREEKTEETTPAPAPATTGRASKILNDITLRAAASDDIPRGTAQKTKAVIPAENGAGETLYAYFPNTLTRKAAHYEDTAGRLRERAQENDRNAREMRATLSASRAGVAYTPYMSALYEAAQAASEKSDALAQRAAQFDVLANNTRNRVESSGGRNYAGSGVQDYRNYLSAPDYGEYSRPAEAKAGGAISGGIYDEQGNLKDLRGNVIGDARYDFINNIGGMRDQVMQYQAAQDQDAAAGTETRMGKADPYGVFSPYIFMNNDEIGVYNYLYAKEGKASADKYLDRIMSDLNGRWRTASEGKMTLFAAQDPVGSSIYSTLMRQSKAFSLLGQAADYMGDGKIDQNARYNRFSFNNSAIRRKVSADVGEKWGPAGSYAYQLGMSMADSLADRMLIFATGGGAAAADIVLAIMGAGAAADTVTSMKDMGYDDNKAMMLGTAAGLIEYATEHAGLDNLIDIVTGKLPASSFIGAAVKGMSSQAVSEGAEEGLADVLNWSADALYALLTGGKTEFKELYDEYVANGATKKDAVRAVVSDKLKELGLDIAGGMISGGLFGAAGAGANLAGRAFDNRPQRTAPEPAQMEAPPPETAPAPARTQAAPAQLPEAVTPQEKLYENIRNQIQGRALEQAAERRQAAVSRETSENLPRTEAVVAQESAGHIDNRRMEDMGDRKINAFSFEHPELHEYYAQAARTFINDVEYNAENRGWTYSRQRDMKGKVGRVYKQPKSSLLSEAKAQGYSTMELIDAARRIINDQGQENTAAAKRLEIILDDMLTNGYTTSYGENIDPNSEYISAKASLPGGSSEADIRIRQARERWDYIDSLEGPADEAELAERAAEIERIRGGRADAAAADIAPETQSGKQEPGAALIGYAREAFDRGETGLSTALTEFYTDSVTDEAGFIGDMTRAYNAGVQGVPFERARVESDAATEPARRAAYLEGVADAQRADASRRPNASKSTAARAQNSGLVRDEYFTKATLTDKEARTLDALGKVLGVEIRFVDRLNATDENGKQSGANAQYLDGVISLSLDSEDPFVTAAVHETVHRVKEMSPEAYDMLERFVRNKMRQGAWDINVEIRRGVYAEEEIPEEIVADGFGRMLRDEDLASEFAEDNRTAWQKFIDALRDILTEIRRFVSGNRKTLSRDQLLAYRDLENQVESMLTLYTQAVKEAGENAAAENRSSEENGKPAKFSMRLPHVIETPRGFYDDRKSYRVVSKGEPVISGFADYGMFADDGTKVSYGNIYGEDLYTVEKKLLANINDYKPAIAQAFREDVENDNLPPSLKYLIERATPEEVAELFDPTDIVDSAEAWDVPELPTWAFEKGVFGYDLKGVKTQDGAIVFDADIAKPADANAVVLGQDSAEGARFSKKGGEKSYSELLKQYGAMEPGENPARDVQVPRRTAPGNKVSQVVRNVMEAKATPDTMLPRIKTMLANGDFSYGPYADEAALRDARAIIGEGWSTALVNWARDVEKGNVSKQNAAIGWLLYDNAANRGDADTALTVLLDMAKHERSAGQALQAARILKKLSPEAQLYGVVKTVEGLNRELREKYGKKAPDLKVEESLAEAFIKAKTPEERDRIMRDIYRDIGRQMPTTLMDRWNAWRYLAMLGNPRTHARNIVGNAGFMPVVAVKNLTATGIEAAVSAVSGGRLERTKGNIVGKNGGKLLKAAWNDYANVKDEALGDAKYNDRANANKQIEEGHVIFGNTRSELWNRTGGKALEAVRIANRNLLDKEDVWFSRPHYALALAQYCAANNITPEDIASGEGIAAARAYAIREAQKATYRDTNDFSQAVSRLGRGSGWSANKTTRLLGGAIEGVLPYRKTPANIFVRGLEYSPLGLLKSISYDMYQLKKGNISGADVIDDISAGLTGTGLVALGVFLAAMGLLRGGGGSDEKKKEFQKLTGHQPYSLELPDGTSITLDWLAPEALPVFVGANLWEISQEREDGLKLADVLTAVGNVTEPMLNMSMLQSLNDVFDTVGYAKEGDVNALTSALASAATNYLTQGLPTLFGQAERTGENQRMTTYTDKNDFLTGDIQYTLGKASARIPGWDYHQIPYIDAWGREELTGKPLERSLSNFFNPAYTSKVDESAMEKELLRLYEQTGENVFPTRAAKYFTVNGARKDLTAKQYVTFATAQGQTAYTVVGQMVKSPQYKSMSDADKAAVVKDAYTYASQTARRKVGGVITESWVEKAVDGQKSYDLSPDQYIIARHIANQIEGVKDSDGNTIANSRGLLRMQAIYGIKGLTDEQRLYLFGENGVGQTIIHYNKAKVNEAVAKLPKGK